MGYGKRIDTLCSLLQKAESFADVGCDHGYCSEYVLKNGLSERVIFSDISKGSLSKAEKLLAPFVKEGKAKGVLGDGFFGVPKDTQEVLIAGMGGSEMVAILSDARYGFLPEVFVLQPMHDGEKLRRYLIEAGAFIERDFTFEDGKFYEVIVGRKRKAGEEKQAYSDAEYEFGKENLSTRGEAFLKRMERLLKNAEAYLLRENLQAESREELQRKKERLQGVLNGEIK
ncbi:MAG: SAM-dependent methyltransferase [Clostridiales bacterium]|nr:SAM-dependent methyltransferase [Clostridiales bacterium]